MNEVTCILGSADYSQVDILSLPFKSVHFGAKRGIALEGSVGRVGVLKGVEECVDQERGETLQ